MRQNRLTLNRRVFKTVGALLLLSSLFVLCSCGGGGKPGLQEIARFPLPEYRPPQSTELPEYLIDFNDLLEIRFFNNDRFNETVRVRPDGRISLERIGDLLVVGRSPLQVDSMITGHYERIIKNPEITVFVREFGTPEVYVLGEVKDAGAVSYRGQLTALQAVSLAGGPSRQAKMGSVLIIRQDNGELVAARWNLDRIVDGDISGGDPPVKPFDVIYLPRNFISKVNEFVDVYLPAILMPLDLSVRWMYYQSILEDNK